MAHLTLAGVSEDGTCLLMVDDAGAEFTLGIDTTLRAAIRGERSRIGELEIQMESALRPRDIQARIRAGESLESVAKLAQTTVDQLMVYAGPVLAERQHVADRAQRSSVRRRSGEVAGARTLGEAVGSHLRSINVDPSTIAWDAWRREDGRWALTGQFSSLKRKGSAEFTFDTPGNYVLLDNDHARWLVGETVAVSPPGAAEAADDLDRPRRRRLSSVPADELPLGDDAVELTKTTPASQDGLDPVEEPAATDETTELEPVPQVPPADDDPPARRAAEKKRGRASVPSWDEIMFGGGGGKAD